MKTLFILRGLIFSLCVFSQSAFSFPLPDPAEVVQAQATNDRVALEALNALFSIDPSGQTAQSILHSQNTPAYPPLATGSSWPARGPSIEQKIQFQIANVLAARARCPNFNGPCYQAAQQQAQKETQILLKSSNPSQDLTRLLHPH